ncbi:MAG: LCP family protein [Dermatophilaceae bacterium]
MGFRRAIGLTALGTILPGAGLTQTRSKRLGWVLLGIAVAVGVVGAYFLLTRGTITTALDLVSRPALVQALGIGFAVCGLIWCLSIALTAIRARPPRLDRGRTQVLTAFTTVMVLLIAGLSYKVAEYTTVTKNTVQSVFAQDPSLPNAGAKVVEGDDPWKDTPRVNILLLGSDAGVGREGTRTDSMVVASIDTKTGKTVLISLPRNLQNVPLPPASPLRGLYPSGVYGQPVCFRAQLDPADECMLNAIWMEVDQYVTDHPDAYRGEAAPGRHEVRDVIGEILGLKIDHTVVVDLKGFQQLVDTMGGVNINVKLSGNGTPLPIGGHSDGRGHVTGVVGYFTAGYQHLSGYYALWYARTRAADDDFFRQQRQRCVLRALIEQVNPGAMVTKYAEVAKIAQDNIFTDIPASNLPAFVDLIQRVQRATIASVALTPATGINPGNPDYPLLRKLVDKAIHPPKPTPKPTSPSTSTGPTTPTPSPTTSTPPVDECA